MSIDQLVLFETGQPNPEQLLTEDTLAAASTLPFRRVAVNAQGVVVGMSLHAATESGRKPF